MLDLAALELDAERRKLARLLAVEAESLHYVDALAAADIRQLRHTVEAHIFDRGAKRFRGLAKSTKLLPNKVNALIAQRALGPRLAAQVAGLLEPKTAVALADQVSLEFRADLCGYLDPRRAGDVLRAMPLEIVLQTSAELVRRGDHMTMARFVDDLKPEQIAAVAAEIDAVSMLWTGFYVESAQSLAQLIGMLDDQQIIGTIHAAANDELWPQSLALMLRVDETTTARMVALLAQQPPAVSASLLRYADAVDGWSVLAQLLQRAEPADQQRLRDMHAEASPDWVRQIDEAA